MEGIATLGELEALELLAELNELDALDVVRGIFPSFCPCLIVDFVLDLLDVVFALFVALVPFVYPFRC